jgi:hypothetical protein
MFQVQDVLIPGRFICFILQSLLTIAIGFAYKDFFPDTTENRPIFWGILILFWILELFELLIILSGYTLFGNLLSFSQIFFHSVSVIILNFFYRDLWDVKLIYIPFIIGGIIPGILEIFNLIILCNSNRTIGKIK